MNKFGEIVLCAFLQLIIITTLNAQIKEYHKQKLLKETTPALITFASKPTYPSKEYQKALKQELNLSSKDHFELLSTQTDNLEFTHQQFQQYYNKIPVENGIYKVHSKDGKIVSMNGDFFNLPMDFITTPKLEATTALELALQKISAKKYAWEASKSFLEDIPQKPKGKLVVLPIEKEEKVIFHLAWQFHISSIIPFDEQWVYVNAHSGEIIAKFSSLAYCSHHHNSWEKDNCLKKAPSRNTSFIPANADTRYNGQQIIETEFFEGKYRLHDYSRASQGILTQTNFFDFGNPPIDFFDEDNYWSAAEYDNVFNENAMLDAHWAAGKTYDYFKSIHNWDSYDNQGGKIQLFIESPEDVGRFSAFTQIGKDISGEIKTLRHVFKNPNTSVDLVAHEISHAYNAATASLGVDKSAGALNEGFSEIWAACVKHFINPNGDKIWQHSLQENTFYHLNMVNPKDRNKPDTYEGEFWQDPNCNSNIDNDYCGIHINNAILYHWFYLLSEGSAQTDEINDKGEVFQVNGIGIEKAAQIAFRLETVYLTPTSSYYGARGLGIRAAEDLFGLDSDEVIATKNAFQAVGLGTENNPKCALVNISTPAQSIVIDNLKTPIEILKIYDDNFNLVFECNANCEDRQVIDNLNSGQFHINLRLMTENYETICEINETVEVGNNDLLCANQGGDSDGDGTCNELDCAPNDPNFPAEPNSICDDLNPLTENDKITADGCNCLGTLIEGGTADCSKLEFITTEFGLIEVLGEGLTDESKVVIEYDEMSLTLCDGNCGGGTGISNLNDGIYLIHVTLVGLDGTVCNRTEEIIIGTPNINNCQTIEFTTQNDQIMLKNLTPQSKVEIIGKNTNWQVQTICDGDCMETQTIPNLMAGEYTVKVNLSSSDGSHCYREEKVSVSGGSNTGGKADCNKLIFTGENGQITISGLTASYDKVEILGKNTDWQVLTICDGDCSDTQIIPDLKAGDYAVKVNQGGNDGTYCYREERVTVGSSNTGGSADCDNLMFTAGDGVITISNLTASYDKVEIIGRNTDWQVVTICEGDCAEAQIIPDLAIGEYAVKVNQGGNNGTYCYREEMVAVTSSSTNRNSEIDYNDELVLYPNPARNEVTLQSKSLKGKTGNIQIFDTFGGLIQSFSNIQFTDNQILNLYDFENGIYWLSVQIEGKSAVGKRFVVETLR